MKYRFEGDDRPPANRQRMREAAWMLPRMWHALLPARSLGPPGGAPALVIPGLVASDRTTRALRQALARAGWRVHGWNMGWNMGVRLDTIERLQNRLEEVSEGQSALLVGWSLGGLFARELARVFPDQVRAVVTLGSPFSGEPYQNNVWRLYELVAGHRVDNPPVARVIDKPPVPTLAIWSRKDGIVAPRSARGLDDERDKAVEIDSSHMAFGVSKRATQKVVLEIETFLNEQGVGREW